MPYGYALKIANRDLLVTAFFTAIGVFIDWTVIHPEVFQNNPAFSYFLLKFLLVGGVAYGVARALRVTHGLHYRLHLGFVVGLIVLQVYYGLYPIPMAYGDPVQAGLWPSIKVGLIVHGGAFLVPIVVVGGVTDWFNR